MSQLVSACLIGRAIYWNAGKLRLREGFYSKEKEREKGTITAKLERVITVRELRAEETTVRECASLPYDIPSFATRIVEPRLLFYMFLIIT